MRDSCTPQFLYPPIFDRLYLQTEGHWQQHLYRELLASIHLPENIVCQIRSKSCLTNCFPPHKFLQSPTTYRHFGLLNQYCGGKTEHSQSKKRWAVIRNVKNWKKKKSKKENWRNIAKYTMGEPMTAYYYFKKTEFYDCHIPAQILSCCYLDEENKVVNILIDRW